MYLFSTSIKSPWSTEVFNLQVTWNWNTYLTFWKAFKFFIKSQKKSKDHEESSRKESEQLMTNTCFRKQKKFIRRKSKITVLNYLPSHKPEFLTLRENTSLKITVEKPQLLPLWNPKSLQHPTVPTGNVNSMSINAHFIKLYTMHIALYWVLKISQNMIQYVYQSTVLKDHEPVISTGVHVKQIQIKTFA